MIENRLNSNNTLLENNYEKEEYEFFINLLINNGICSIKQIDEAKINKDKPYNEVICELIDYLFSEGFILSIKNILEILPDFQNFYNRFEKIATQLKILTKDQVKFILRQQNLKNKNDFVESVIELKIISKENIQKVYETQKLKNDSIVKDASFMNNYGKIFEILAKYKNIETNIESKIKTKIEISGDKMTASIVQFGKNKFNTLDNLKKEFFSLGIIYGIVSDDQIQKFIDNPILPFVFAKGKNLINSFDSKIENICDFYPNYLNNKYIVPKKDKFGKFNIPRVKKGDILQKKIPIQNGIVGIDVFGNEIRPTTPVDNISIKNKNTKIGFENVLFEIQNIDGVEYEVSKAKYNGIPCINKELEIFIASTTIIDENIFFENDENDIFNGDMYGILDIRGGIKNVKIEGLAEIEVKTNIISSTISALNLKNSGTIEYSNITLDKDLIAFNITNTKIYIGGNISAENISKSTIYCNILDVKKSINSSKIYVSDSLKISEINLDNEKQIITIIDSKIISEMNKLNLLLVLFQGQIYQLNQYLKSKNEMKSKYDKLNNILKEKSFPKEDMEKGELVLKNINIKIEELNKKIDIILTRVSKNKNLEDFFKSGLNKEEITDKIQKFFKNTKIKLENLKNEFLKSRENPIISIDKTLSNITIEENKKKIFFEKGSVNIRLYQNLIFEDGTYSTNLSEKKVSFNII